MLYGFGFAVPGVTMPFLPLWFGATGIGPEAIGLLLALPILVRIVVTRPLLGLADRGLAPKTLLVWGSALAALAYAGMPAAGGWGIVPLAALTVAAAAGQAAFLPTVDHLSLGAMRGSLRFDYGHVRLWGSIAFLAANAGAGALVGASASRDAPIMLIAGLLLATASASVLAPGLPAEAEPRGGGGAGADAVPKALWLALAAGAAIQGSHAAVYGFGSLHWRALGVPELGVGLLWATGVVAEIALFAGSGRLPAVLRGPFVLLGIGAAAASCRWLGLAAAGDALAAVVPLQVLHGLSFGATHLGTMAALARYAPAGARGRTQGTSAVIGALATAGATVACGIAARGGGVQAAFLLMVPLAGLGLALVAAGAATAGRTRENGRGLSGEPPPG